MKNLALFLLVLLLACTKKGVENNASEHAQFYDVRVLLDQLVVNGSKYGVGVDKTVKVNGNSEQKKITQTDSSFWQNELALLYEADLNKPINHGKYLIKSKMTDPSSNLTYDMYSNPNDSEPGIAWEKVFYMGIPMKIRKMEYLRKEKNSLFYSRRTVKLWLNEYRDTLLIDSLMVTGQNKMIGQDSLSYYIFIKRLH